jgi:pimeloyl-ACP methyl ester carboxylesterase
MHDVLTTRFVEIHGHRVAYRAGGEGPAVVFVHGIAGSSSTFARIMPTLAQTHTVIAPDLLGHGESAKPRGDYSLGGGIAMQMSYMFPESCERLVLVASGGLGKEVSPLLRLIAAPGSELVLPLVLTRQLHGLAERIGGIVARSRLRGDPLLTEIWSAYTRLTDARAQRAFVHTIRAVIDTAGQRVSARDRLYLARDVPTLILWGDRDRVIPVSHAHAAHELMPGSRLEIIEGAGHFLLTERPDEVLEPLLDFLTTTEPAHVSPRTIVESNR